jgi:hypothetical protein
LTPTSLRWTIVSWKETDYEVISTIDHRYDLWTAKDPVGRLFRDLREEPDLKDVKAALNKAAGLYSFTSNKRVPSYREWNRAAAVFYEMSPGKENRSALARTIYQTLFVPREDGAAAEA